MSGLLPLTVVIFAGVGALAGWLTCTVGSQRNDESKLFSNRVEARTWFALIALESGLSAGASALLYPSWWPLFSDRSGLTQGFCLLAIVLLFVVAFVGPIIFRPGQEFPLYGHRVRIGIVYLFAFVPVTFAMSGMVLIAVDADSLADQEAAKIDIAAVLDQMADGTRTLRLFLGTAALLIAAALIATAGLRRALLAHEPARNFSSSDLILYGLLFTVSLATFFVPSYAQMQDANWRLVDKVLSRAPVDPPSDDWFTIRSDLVSYLSLDVTLAKLFAGAFAILTPIASGYLATFFDASAKTAATSPNLARLPRSRPPTRARRTIL